MRLLVGQFWGRGAMARSSWQLPRKWKFFSGRHAGEGAQYEAGLLKALASLSACDSQWFPVLLAASPSAEPWPWMSSSFGGPSLAKVISDTGPLAPSHLQAFVSQLECALRVLHKKAGLLHLDTRPSNILWCAELNCLKVCDFGMAAERWQSASGFLKSETRFEQYVTSWYRPPELWQLDGRIASLQKALFKSFGGSLEFWMRGVWSRLRCCLDAANEGQQLSKQDHSKLVQELAQLTLGRPRQGQT